MARMTRVRFDRIAGVSLDAPPRCRRRQVGHQGIREDGDALVPGVREQRVAHVARALGFRKELRRLALFDERHGQVALEERPLLVERPRADDAPERMRRGIGDESRVSS